jgi:hypothetical protein
VQIEIATPDGEPQTSIGGVLAAADYRFSRPGAVRRRRLPADRLGRLAAYATRLFGLLRQVPGRRQDRRRDLRRDRRRGPGRAAGRQGPHLERRRMAGWARRPAMPAPSGYVDTPKAVTDGKLVTASGLAPVTFSAAIGRLVAPERATSTTTMWRCSPGSSRELSQIRKSAGDMRMAVPA